MSRPHLILIIFTSASIFMIGCHKPNECQCLKSNGKQIEVHRNLSDFNKILLKDNINLSVVQDTVNELILSVPENLANFIKTDVNGGVLNIYNENKCNWLRSFKIDINVLVRTRALQNIECRGSGNVKTVGFIEKDYFEIIMDDASGKIELMLKARNTSVLLTNGPADIYICGYTDSSYVYNAGTGFIFMQNFDTRATNIYHNGTGQCYVNASDKLYATLDYVGDINYWGNPAYVQLIDNGEGKIIKH